MMEDNAPWILSAQETIGQLVQRPRITAKLLLRPPFRFLHDVVMEVRRLTGFPLNVFTSDELDPDYFQDKSNKLAFLRKLIASISIALDGKFIDVSPTKIVSGLEPEKTAQLLVDLHAAASKPLPSETTFTDPNSSMLSRNTQPVQPEAITLFDGPVAPSLPDSLSAVTEDLLPSIRAELELLRSEYARSHKVTIGLLSRLKLYGT